MLSSYCAQFFYYKSLSAELYGMQGSGRREGVLGPIKATDGTQPCSIIQASVLVLSRPLTSPCSILGERKSEKGSS